MDAYVLNITDPPRREIFLDRFGEGRFAEPVPTFSHGRGSALLVLISAERGRLTHVASGRPGVKRRHGS